jgi:hypothetical protein
MTKRFFFFGGKASCCAFFFSILSDPHILLVNCVVPRVKCVVSSLEKKQAEKEKKSKVYVIASQLCCHAIYYITSRKS